MKQEQLANMRPLSSKTTFNTNMVGFEGTTLCEVQLPSPTADNIEMRLYRDQYHYDEDLTVEYTMYGDDVTTGNRKLYA